MIDYAQAPLDRIDELLADRALQGLSVEETTELHALLEAHPNVDADAFDYAAAMMDRATMTDDEPLPATLRARILGAHEPAVAPIPFTDAAPSKAPQMTPPQVSTRALTWLGWLAAAACLAIAVLAWLPARQLTPVDQLARLQQRASDIVTVAWTRGEDPAGAQATGQVIWSTEQQRGFMTFTGLEKNDPTKQQYQLWIFDREQPTETPIDGGVFDIDTERGEAVVPIDAKLPVTEPYLFAITIEKPGGVVVSDRSRLPLLADPTAAAVPDTAPDKADDTAD